MTRDTKDPVVQTGQKLAGENENIVRQHDAASESGHVDLTAEPIEQAAQRSGATASPDFASAAGSTNAQSEPAEATSADAGLAYWLVGSIRPSGHPSLPPARGDGDGSAMHPNLSADADAATLTSPETLAPQIMPSDELEPEDLAVLPGSHHHGKRSLPGKPMLIALGSLAVVLLLGNGWWQAPAPAPSAPVAAAPAIEAKAMVAETPAAAHHSRQAVEHPEAEASPSAPSNLRHYAWAPPGNAESEPEPPGTAQPWYPGGPSVGRLPDLPMEVWSRLRAEEKLRKQLQRAATSSEPAAATADFGAE